MKIYEVKTKKDMKDFTMFPYKLYNTNPYWVPPLISDAEKMTKGDTPLFKKGLYKHFLVKNGNEVLGRITCGIDELFNRAKGIKEGYFTLFETVDDKNVSQLLFKKIEHCFKNMKVVQIKGPISPTNGDDFRGLLVQNFNSPPSLLESYNPPYYKNILEEMGYESFYDFYSYLFDLNNLDLSRYENTISYAMEKSRFTVEAIPPKKFNTLIPHLKEIMDEAIPQGWLDPIIPPTVGEIREVIKELTPLAVVGSLIMAYSNDGKPLGFSASLPNYNEVLKKLNGRVFPVGWLKFLYYKRQIKSAKTFIMFVIPSWHKKGVSSSIYFEGLKYAKKYGYKWLEGGTIGKDNRSMKRDVEKLGGKQYKTFRLYIKKFKR